MWSTQTRCEYTTMRKFCDNERTIPRPRMPCCQIFQNLAKLGNRQNKIRMESARGGFHSSNYGGELRTDRALFIVVVPPVASSR